MSLPRTVKSFFVPPPVDGLNLIASPTQIKSTEARTLDNYRCFDSGIRQINCPTQNLTDSSGGVQFSTLFNYIDTAGTERMIACASNKIKRLDTPTGVALTDLTNATAITNNAWNILYFNKQLLFFNGTDTPRKWDRSAGTVSDFTATGPTVTTLKQATQFKRRLYIVQASSTVFWYASAVEAFAGVFTSYDLGAFFDTSGDLLFIFNWTFNQGTTSEELFCAVNTRGEILIYAGDNPAAANWGLVSRIQIPEFVSTPTGAPIAKTANEVYISTSRGLIPMTSLVAGIAQSRPYYTLSRNIKDQVNRPIAPVLDASQPFLYAAAGSSYSDTSIFCLNYERGAWSRFDLSTAISGHSIASLCRFGGYLMIGTQKVGGPAIYRIDLSGESGSALLEYTWSTPFFNFGSNLQKRVQLLRLLGKNLGTSTVFESDLYVAKDFVDSGKPSPPNLTQKYDTVAQNAQVVQEMSPFGGVGRWLSYVFSRDANASNELNEYQGFEVLYEEGGVY